MQEMLKITGIRKSFSTLDVLKGVDLTVHKGEVVSLIGPSGSGKTTLLRCANFLDQAEDGTMVLDGQTYHLGHVRRTEMYEARRHTAFVFQNYNLFLNKTALQNVTEGLIVARKMPRDEAEARAQKALEKVGLGNRGASYPNQLSGGQQQRVAIARALVNRPKVLLLDEPLGALDLKLRKEMQIELKRIQQALEITFIYVTHDQEEALTMSDRVVVMRDGNILQIGTPQDIYNEPCNAFVADFIGESNIIDGIMHKDFLVEFANDYFDCVDKGFQSRERVQVVVRPEDFKIVPADQGKISGIVESVIFKGVHYEIMVDAMGYKWKIHTTQYVEPGTLIGMNVAPMDIHIMKRTEE